MEIIVYKNGYSKISIYINYTYHIGCIENVWKIILCEQSSCVILTKGNIPLDNPDY